MKYLAPNLTLLLGAEIAAKLVTEAGGLNELATTPSGNILNMGRHELNLEGFSTMNKFDKERKIFSIVVDDLSKQNSNKTEFVKSIIPICPKCYENVEFDIINFKIIYLNVKMGIKLHKNPKISIR